MDDNKTPERIDLTCDSPVDNQSPLWHINDDDFVDEGPEPLRGLSPRDRALAEQRQRDPYIMEDGYEKPDAKAEAFDFYGVHVFLTYSQVDKKLKHSDVLEALQEKFGTEIEEYWIAREEHKDGGIHYHVLLSFQKKKRIRNAIKNHSFSVYHYHPNIVIPKPGDKSKKNLTRYICKDGKFTTNIRNFDYSNPVNFRNRVADYAAWQMHAAIRVHPQFKITDLVLPDGQNFADVMVGRIRSLLLVGGPALGKSSWLSKQIGDSAVFTRANSKFPYEGYAGEPVIVWDDVSFENTNEIAREVTCILTPHTRVNMPVFGETRYTKTYFPVNVDLSIIWISNGERQEPTLNNLEWFNTRFYYYFLNHRLY